MNQFENERKKQRKTKKLNGMEGVLRVAALSHFHREEKSVPHWEQMNGIGGGG